MTGAMNASIPPTPPSRAPKKDELRFKLITSPCEWVEDYYPGGYHPVVLGDVFNDGQYEVIRKLGEGSFSTVWLACEERRNKYVALKILVSNIPESNNELRILHHIANAEPERGPRYITQLLGEFEHHGPDGVHKCLAFEPMGPTVNHMVEELPQFKPRKWGMNVRYPPWMAKAILKQSLEALAFLHENGIAHGDFQPGNMLFALEDIDTQPESELRQDEDVEAGSISPPVQRLDGKEDNWAPKYLCVAQTLAPYTKYSEGFKIKLSDMGGAFFFTDPPAKPITPGGLRAPELILTGSVHKTLDIWSYGCLVYEIVTGKPLFCVPWLESESEQDDDHLLLMTARLGPLPEELYTHWKRSSLYFSPDRELLDPDIEGVDKGGQAYISAHMSMEEAFDKAGPDLSEEVALVVKRLIRRILQYDPAHRPSPADILRDPWFCEQEVGSGSSIKANP